MNETIRILVIDDNPVDLKLICSVLKNQGYEVFSADEAPAGLEKAMEWQPSLIILDVMMPIINGYNICRLIKDQKQYGHIPILLLTSRSSDEDRRIGQEAGADAYMAKPFDTQKLLETVSNLVRR